MISAALGFSALWSCRALTSQPRELPSAKATRRPPSDAQIQDVGLTNDLKSLQLPAIGEWFRTSGFFAPGDGGGVCLRRLSAKDQKSRFDFQDRNGTLLTIIDQAIDPKMLGAIADGKHIVSDIITRAVQLALTLDADFAFSKGVYLVDRNVQFSNRRNFEITFEPGASLKVLNTSQNTLPHVLGLANCENVTVYDIAIDGDGYQGANGIGIGGSSTGVSRNIRIRGGHFKNLKRSPLPAPAPGAPWRRNGGGRAVALQFNCYDCSVTDVEASNCTTALDIHGNRLLPTLGIVARRIRAEDCEEVVSFYDLADVDSNPDDTGAMSCLVEDVKGHNCGRSTADLSVDKDTGGTGGGLIISERARHITVRNFQVTNDPAYGIIGGVFRGTGQHITLENIFFRGQAVAAVQFGPARNLLPLYSIASDRVVTRSFTLTGMTCLGELQFIALNTSDGGTLKVRDAVIRRVTVQNTRRLISGSFDLASVGEFRCQAGGRAWSGAIHHIATQGSSDQACAASDPAPRAGAAAACTCSALR